MLYALMLNILYEMYVFRKKECCMHHIILMFNVFRKKDIIECCMHYIILCVWNVINFDFAQTWKISLLERQQSTEDSVTSTFLVSSWLLLCVDSQTTPPNCTGWFKLSHWSIFEFLVRDFLNTFLGHCMYSVFYMSVSLMYHKIVFDFC